LQVGAALLLVGWAGTAVLQRNPTVTPLRPITAAVGLWLGIFALIAGVALLLTPRSVWYNRVVLVWVGLNTAAFGYTGAVMAGLLPSNFALYAYWHIWVAAAVVGFTVTGVALEDQGIEGQVYFTAAGLELSLLFLGLGAFGTLIPGLYLLLALVHPTPLLLDAFPADLSNGRVAAIQLGIYAAGLGLVLLA
jgi:hypothetical protein